MIGHATVAAVTAALHVRLRRALQVTGLNADVSHTRPGTSNAFPNQVGMHAFLYMVTPNATLRNIDVPTRDAQGKIVRRPSVALDLHYLLSFVGDEAQHEPQRMLGAVALELEVNPVLTADELRDALDGDEPARAPLQPQVERVRIVRETLDLEEFSKLWSVFFQTQYLLSIAYKVSVVLLEAEVEVAARPRIREPRIHTAPLPQIVSIEPQMAPPGARVTIHGSLYGDAVVARFAPEHGPPIDVEPDRLHPDRLEVVLPPELPAGIHTARLVTRDVAGSAGRPTQGFEFASGELPFMLVPRILAPGGTSAERDTLVELEAAVGSTVAIDVVPPILEEQQVQVLVGPVRVEPTERVSGEDGFTTLRLQVPDDPALETGRPQPLRVQVDRAVSLVEAHEDGLRPRLVVTGGS